MARRYVNVNGDARWPAGCHIALVAAAAALAAKLIWRLVNAPFLCVSRRVLRSLSLRNFRGFSDHRVDFGKESILIGRNNAGKTTVVEALRVLSVCQARVHTTGFMPCPSWLDQHCQGAGFRPSLETIDFDFANVQHGYDTEQPAQLRAKLSNNNEVHVYIGKGPEEVFCQLRKGPRHIVHERREIGPTTFGTTKVMPPIGSLSGLRI